MYSYAIPSKITTLPVDVFMTADDSHQESHRTVAFQSLSLTVTFRFLQVRQCQQHWLIRRGQTRNAGDVPSLLQQWLLFPVKGLPRCTRTSGISGEDVAGLKYKLLGCLCVTDQHHSSAQEQFLFVFHSWKRRLRQNCSKL